MITSVITTAMFLLPGMPGYHNVVECRCHLAPMAQMDQQDALLVIIIHQSSITTVEHWSDIIDQIFTTPLDRFVGFITFNASTRHLVNQSTDRPNVLPGIVVPIVRWSISSRPACSICPDKLVDVIVIVHRWSTGQSIINHPNWLLPADRPSTNFSPSLLTERRLVTTSFRYLDCQLPDIRISSRPDAQLDGGILIVCDPANWRFINRHPGHRSRYRHDHDQRHASQDELFCIIE